MRVDRLDVSFNPSGLVLGRFLGSRVRRSFIEGPLGSGKTFTCAMKALKASCEQAPQADGVRRTTGLVTRTNMTDLESSAMKDWLDLTEGKFGGALGKFSWASPRKHELRFRLPDETRVEADIWFIGLDEPDGVTKVRGMPLTWAWLNEAKDFPFQLVTMIYGRCGRYPRMEDGGPSWHGLFGDTNMPDVGHWLYRLAEETRPEGWEFLRQPGGVVKVDGKWVLNPGAENLRFLPPGYYPEMLAGAEDSWIDVYLAANYGYALSGTPVYPDYNDIVHVKPNLEAVAGVPLQRGWDFGLTPACVISQMQPGGRWAILDEICADEAGVGADSFSDDVLLHCGRNWKDYTFDDVGDPAGTQRAQTDEKTCFQILRAKRIDIQPGKQDLEIRLACVRRPLKLMERGTPMLALHPRCKMLRKGFMGGYRYRRMHTNAVRYTEKPEKNEFSHPHDALQYTATKLFSGVLLIAPKGEPKKVDERFKFEASWQT